jgi:Glycosyltransferase family 10 (fucosyltransferase) C-term
MYRVRVTTSFPNMPLIRQTPGRTGVWGQFQFIINQPVQDYQFWVLFDRFPERLSGRCAEANTVFISAEPPSLARYSRPFVEQFGTVITCHRSIRGPNVIHSQQALPWQVGISGYHVSPSLVAIMGYDELKTPAFQKKKLISVIASDRRGTRGHNQRYTFVQRLRQRMRDRIDVFGAGTCDIQDKWDGIAPYQYHIAIENSVVPDYWTEKLADGFLGGAFPIYHGCPNIHDYFSKQSMRLIDISDADRAINDIEAVIEGEEYERNQDQIVEARRLVLDEYNFFPMVAKLLAKKDPNAVRTELEFKPLAQCERLPRRMVRSVTRRLPSGLRRFIK